MSKLNILDPKEFGKEITGKQISFLIGSGASMPFIPTLKINIEDFKGYLEERFFDFKNQIFKDESEMSFEDIYESENIREFISDMDKIYYEKILKKGFLLQEQYQDYKDILLNYEMFIKNIVSLLDLHSIDVRKKVNIFTTNYDLFFEKAADNILAEEEDFVFNDGFRGFVNRKFNLFNYNMKYYFSSSYANSIYNEQVKTINFYKLHGSLSWEEENGNLKYNYNDRKDFSKISIVYPTKNKFKSTLMNLTYHNLLREYVNSIDFGSNVLIVFGFSFADEHIRELTKRALKNPNLLIYIFCYDKDNFSKVYKYFYNYKNVKYVVTKKYFEETKYKNVKYIDESCNLTLKCLNTFLKAVPLNEEVFIDEE